MEVKTMRQAALDGDRKYYTGKLCVNGHDSARYTSSGVCIQCNADKCKRSRETIKKALQGHMIKVCVQVHPDDKANIEGTAEFLRKERWHQTRQVSI